MKVMNETERKQLEQFITEILRGAVSDDYARYILENDNIIEDIIDDVLTSSAWEDERYYNEDDIRLAIGRILITKLNIEV